MLLAPELYIIVDVYTLMHMSVAYTCPKCGAVYKISFEEAAKRDTDLCPKCEKAEKAEVKA